MGIKVVRRKPKTAGKTISDEDRSLAEKFLNRNDGGVASKTRRF